MEDIKNILGEYSKVIGAILAFIIIFSCVLYVISEWILVGLFNLNSEIAYTLSMIIISVLWGGMLAYGKSHDIKSAMQEAFSYLGLIIIPVIVVAVVFIPIAIIGGLLINIGGFSPEMAIISLIIIGSVLFIYYDSIKETVIKVFKKKSGR